MLDWMMGAGVFVGRNSSESHAFISIVFSHSYYNSFASNCCYYFPHSTGYFTRPLHGDAALFTV